MSPMMRDLGRRLTEWKVLAKGLNVFSNVWRSELKVEGPMEHNETTGLGMWRQIWQKYR